MNFWFLSKLDISSICFNNPQTYKAHFLPSTSNDSLVVSRLPSSVLTATNELLTPTGMSGEGVLGRRLPNRLQLTPFTDWYVSE